MQEQSYTATRGVSIVPVKDMTHALCCCMQEQSYMTTRGGSTVPVKDTTRALRCCLEERVTQPLEGQLSACQHVTHASCLCMQEQITWRHERQNGTCQDFDTRVLLLRARTSHRGWYLSCFTVLRFKCLSSYDFVPCCFAQLCLNVLVFIIGT